MDIFRIDRDGPYIPDKMIEGYESMIWTERYQKPGEFEMKTPKVKETRALIQEGSLITHRQTREVMMVESLVVTPDDNNVPSLVVKGRSLTAQTDGRYLEGPYPNKSYAMARNYTYAEAVCVMLWNAFVNPTANDVTRLGPGGREILDTIPQTVVTDSTTVGGTSKRRWLTGGPLTPQVLQKLQPQSLGIRMLRPDSRGLTRIDVSTDDKGIITRVVPDPVNKLAFDVYNGQNRSRLQTANKSVIFHAAGGYLTDQSYLWAITDSCTMVIIVSGVGTKRYYRNRATDRTLSGLDRRVNWIDGGDPQLEEIPDQPDDPTAAQLAAWRKKRDEIKAKNAETRAAFLEDLQDKADAELKAHDRVQFFDAKVGTTSPYVYGRDYFLGDKVTLLGDYDFDQTMIVSEYVRTEDHSGDVGYPGLVASLDDDA